MNDEPADRNRWNESIGNALPDSILLIGLTYLTAEGEFVGQQQFFGKVRSAQPDRGILVDLRGARAGETYNLPPDTRSIHRAAPGEYRPRSTGEVVVDPDFTATFTVHKP